MLRPALVGCFIAFVASAPAAGAAAPLQVAFPIDHTSPIPELTPICGFDVSLTVTGTSKGTIFHDRAGEIVRELDTQPDTRFIWSSSTTGKSFAYPWSATYHYDYVDGNVAGSRVVVTVSGFGDKTPGVPASAGRVVFEDAVLLFVTPDGVPIVDFGMPTSATGHSNDPDAVDAAICAALAP
jgi:hypothetical protein